MGVRIKIKNKEILKEETERIKESLDDLERYIEEFSAFLPLGVCTVSPLGIIIDVNNAFKKMAGFGTLEISGKNLETLFLEKEKVKEIIKEIKDKEIIEGEELTLVSKSKKKIPTSVSFGARKDRKGNLFGFFIGITNISELKKLQEELEKEVEERTKEIREKIEELEAFRKLAVGRELQMVSLKDEIETLKKKLKNKI